jgi:hypothetical protein
MAPVQGLGGAPGMYQEQQYQHLVAEEHRHKQNEHRAGVAALGAAAFAAYELHEEKVDPAHARRHHMEAQAAEAAALGLGGYALYEHHQAHKIHKAEEQIPGHHHQKHGHNHHTRHHHHGFWNIINMTFSTTIFNDCYCNSWSNKVLN